MNTRKLLTILAVTTLASCGSKTTEPEALAVVTETVAETSTSSGRSYVGEVEAYTSTPVSFTGMGTVTRVLVSEGQAVSRGQKLAQMDATQAQNTLTAAEAILNQAKDAYNRMKVLHDAAALSDIDWVDTESKLKQAESTMAIAKKALADCDLIAPCSGVIGKGPMESGVTALPSQTVCTILDISKVKVKASIPEKEIGSVTASTPTVITVASLGEKTFSGEKIEKGVEADAMTRTYDIKATVANPDKQLLPGMVAQLQLTTDGNSPAVTVPVRCIQQGTNGNLFVWTVSDGKAHRTDVTTGATEGDRIAIIAGINKGDKVIVSGYQKVSEGSDIKE